MRVQAALILALAATAALAGEIYTWKDSSGRVHYSDTPPPGTQNMRTLRGATTDTGSAAGTPAPAAATGAPAQKSLPEKELEFRKRKAEADEAKAKADKEQAAAEERRRGCEQARAQLAALESGQRVARFNAQGEREFLDDAQRAAEIERTRKSVADLCK